MRTRSFATAVAVAALAVGATAYAAEETKPAAPSSPAIAPTAPPRPLAAPTAAAVDETAMAANAKVSIAKAIETAETKGAGKATEVEFDDEGGGRWEVKVLADDGNRLTTYFIDPNSSEVKGAEEQTFEKYFTMLKPGDFAKAATQLRDAIASAEGAAKGKAVSAEVERKGDSVAYEIYVSTPDGVKDVRVDAMGKAVLD